MFYAVSPLSARASVPRALKSGIQYALARGKTFKSGLSPLAMVGCPGGSKTQQQGSSPVILLDIMDTVVHDPFFTHMSDFFGLTFEQLLREKHPSSWVEFEKGEIDQDELFSRFFIDGRGFDGTAFLEFVCSKYEFVDGMEEILQVLAGSGYELHAFSNYPLWYRRIEDKLQLGRYLNWTFISCEGPMKGLRKPSKEAFDLVVNHLGRPASDIIFVDDRESNVEAARLVGMRAIQFKDSLQLKNDLKKLEIHTLE